ncbi:2-oxoacid:acceptor oxidoreductase subunit alpha [Alicyclobacillaceae bacterium I2511]|nr:2-oxoacid:acceptor oxidoreductase subunit alpha [Alicyclobacillaceae bacterium I2511]
MGIGFPVRNEFMLHRGTLDLRTIGGLIMSEDIGWKVGGKQGEGIDSTGDIYAVALHRMGYYVFTYRHFMSLIKGGHTNYKVRSSNQVLRHHGDLVHVLVAFDPTTIDYNWHELVDGAVVIYDTAEFEAKAPDTRNVNLCGVPLTELAKESGNSIMKNMVAIGASACIHELDVEALRPVIQEKFGKKGPAVVEQNMAALQRGFAYFEEHFTVRFPLPRLKEQIPATTHLYASGNQAVGFGALAGGCRFLSAYPITPATEIMYWAIAQFPRYGGVVVQAEDEIAAMNMAIGANFTGVRAMTSTSGPGFSLMMEALGLAGMSETPVVVVDVQRSGPSTGLPTKTEQSDLNEALYGTHGEIQRIVLTPRTVEECFLLTAEAFNLAERYQLPVIVLSDMYLGMSSQTINEFPLDQIHHDRGKLLQVADLEKMGANTYQRYNLDVADGISARALPGQKNGRHVALGNEHSAVGLEIEDMPTRRAQVAKRQRKLADFQHFTGVYQEGNEKASAVLIGFGSTWGVLEEARLVLENSGFYLKHIHFSRLAPFPVEAFQKAMQGVETALVVEQNSTGQLAELIQKEVGFHDRLHRCLRFDGDPFTLQEIIARSEQVFSLGVLH